jgi:hypothetical protein
MGPGIRGLLRVPESMLSALPLRGPEVPRHTQICEGVLTNSRAANFGPPGGGQSGRARLKVGASRRAPRLVRPITRDGHRQPV